MGDGIKGVGLDFRTNLPPSKGLPFPGDTGYSPWDSMSVAPGASMHAGGGGVVISLGQVGNQMAWVRIPEDIFKYYPDWMKEHGRAMDIKRWEQLSQIKGIELEKTDRHTKTFFEMMKIIAALAIGTDPSVLAMIGDGYQISVTKNGDLIAEMTQNTARTDNGIPRIVKTRDLRKEALEAKVAGAVVDGLFLPVTLARAIGKTATRVFDAVGKGLEALWNFGQPILTPIGNLVATIAKWTQRQLKPLFSFLQEHTRPTRAREDVAVILTWMLSAADRLAGATGLKYASKALVQVFSEAIKLSGRFIVRTVNQLIITPLQAMFRPIISWISDKSTQIVDALQGFVKGIWGS